MSKKKGKERKERERRDVRKKKKNNHGYVAVSVKKNCYDNDRQGRNLLIGVVVYASFVVIKKTRSS